MTDRLGSVGIVKSRRGMREPGNLFCCEIYTGRENGPEKGFVGKSTTMSG